jgi:hypothetical protein
VVNDKEVLKKGRMMEGVFCGGINGERKRRMKGNLFYFPASTFSLVNLVSSDIFFYVKVDYLCMLFPPAGGKFGEILEESCWEMLEGK